ncbi:MAG: OmpA family protein [Flavobacterium sp.]|nr:OmpA family protein [Flavobacterium sp.]
MTLNIRLFFIGICFCFSTLSFGQGNALGVHVSTTEYVGDLNNNSFANLYQFNFIALGGGLSLQQKLNASFNLVESAFYNKVQYKTLDKTLGVDANFFTLNLKLKYKFNNGYLLGEKAFFAPFLTVGAGATYTSAINSGLFQAPFAVNEFIPDLAAGAGAVIRFSQKFYLEYAATFHQPMFDGWDGVTKDKNDLYLQHSLGLIFTLKTQEKKDTDGDGVKDSRDKCPETPAGTEVDFWGCPKTIKSNDDDSDGVRNRYDECPNTPRGTTVNQRGCPITIRSTDDDGDGVKNRYDECPDTPPDTKVGANGCPEKVYTSNSNTSNYNSPSTTPPVVSDDDGDGVPNSSDKCPYTYGSSKNYGCPEVREESKKRLEFATHGIYFETGKATIKPLSYSVLNDIVAILQEYKDYHVRLAGHTDAVGSNINNYQLSDDRVISVKNYLISKGVNAYRFETRGFGKTRPVASNTTVEGRSENRRVEIQLFLK